MHNVGTETSTIEECNMGIHVTNSETLIAHFVIKAYMDVDLFFRCITNFEIRLGNIFWVDSIGRFDYSYFCDLVAFDATYKTNAYVTLSEMLVGVNHHYQTVIFGMALIVDKTVDNYTWVLKTFLDTMKNKHL